MAKSKKINPNRILCTQADVNRAVDRATSAAIGCAFKMVLYIMVDKYGVNHEAAQQLSRDLEWLANSLYSDKPEHLTWSDVDRVLRENDVKIKFTHEEESA